MLPTSESDITPICYSCDRLITHTSDGLDRRICGWYGEPDFACTDRLDIAQSVDVAEVTSDLTNLITRKYVRGVAEHGGYGWEMGATRVLDNAFDEVADLATYLHWVRDALSTIRVIAATSGEPAIREAIVRVIDGVPGRR